MEKKCVLVYASISGNTKQMAEAIAAEVVQCGCQLDIKEMYETDARELMDYDSILLGASTWSDGDVPDEAFHFYDEMDELNLHGKTAAVFGSGDDNYAIFGGAVDRLQRKLWERGADVLFDGLKINQSPSAADLNDCRKFGRIFVEQSAYYDK